METKGLMIIVGIAMIIVGLEVGIRIGIGKYGYSGEKTPPKYGDYEAQRHWSELTINLPLGNAWYEYDTAYWGLDYPPLTAYHAWLVGQFAFSVEPAMVAFETSRGF